MGSGCCHPTLTPETKSASPSRRKAGKCGSLSMNICFMIILTIIVGRKHFTYVETNTGHGFVKQSYGHIDG